MSVTMNGIGYNKSSLDLKLASMSTEEIRCEEERLRKGWGICAPAESYDCPSDSFLRDMATWQRMQLRKAIEERER